ncbi:MAG: DUF1844 domain-containing protein [Planctomycetia bacterium]|nr:DUF1844 domain-containing protein [Planctomycetia bacterium]
MSQSEPDNKSQNNDTQQPSEQQNSAEKENAKQHFEMPQDVPLPAPNLISLATSLATQAMVSMGIFPNPMTGQSTFLLHQAKHLIDTVQLLFDKTAGNRTDEESKMLENVIHELHMLFIAAQNEKSRRNE